MTKRAVEALSAARAAESERKQHAVKVELGKALSRGGHITMSGIAQEAGVSRQFIYSHAELKTLVEQAAKTAREQPKERGDSSTTSNQGLRATQGMLMAKVDRQKATIAELQARLDDFEQQRKRWLGEQLEAQVAVSVEEHAELRAACDRLMTDKAALSRTVSELQRINKTLEAELAASRQAHAEDVARLNREPGDVTALVARQGQPNP